MKVWTFEQIINVLKVAGERKCQEAQACLEGMRVKSGPFKNPEYLLWFGFTGIFTLKFLSQFDFYFPLFQNMIMNMRTYM